jgi:hypothetical protein
VAVDAYRDVWPYADDADEDDDDDDDGGTCAYSDV